MNLVTLVIIIVAFAVGYKLIGWLMDRLRLSRTAPDAAGPVADGRTNSTLGGQPPASRSADRTASGSDGGRTPSYETPEARFARVLGLPQIYTRAEITTRYQTLIAQYHPDKIRHVDSDLQEVAKRRTGEIAEAYEYFRVKYNLR